MYRNFLKNLKILIATLVIFFAIHYVTHDLLTTIIVTNLSACLFGVICHELNYNVYYPNIHRTLFQKVKTFLYLFLLWCIISMIGMYSIVEFLEFIFGLSVDNIFVYVGIYTVIATVGIEVDHYLLKRAFFIVK